MDNFDLYIECKRKTQAFRPSHFTPEQTDSKHSRAYHVLSFRIPDEYFTNTQMRIITIETIVRQSPSKGRTRQRTALCARCWPGKGEVAEFLFVWYLSSTASVYYGTLRENTKMDITMEKSVKIAMRKENPLAPISHTSSSFTPRIYLLRSPHRVYFHDLNSISSSQPLTSLGFPLLLFFFFNNLYRHFICRFLS